MPYATNNGVRIHYQTEGQGSPLVLYHGFSMTSEDWREYGYVAELRDRYRLILIDSRGYGASDKPHDANRYALSELVGDVNAVIDDLQLSQIFYWGWSMGGDLAFAIAQASPERLKKMIIGGACAPRGFDPDDPNEFRDTIEQNGASWLAELWKQHLPISDAQEARLNQLDIGALLADLRCPRPNLESIPQSMSMPCLLYIGESEEAYDCALNDSKQLPKGEFVSFPGFNHFDTWARSDVVLPHVLEFLNEG